MFMTIIEKIEMVEKQEKELQFKSFDNEAALEIGLMLVKEAKSKKYPVAINITRSNQQLFHVALPGASINNEHWIRRKVNTVYHFQQSSLLVQYDCESNKSTLAQIHALPDTEFAAAGGCFPVIVKGVGMVGTITVSGLSSEQDHDLIVNCLIEYLNK